MIAVSFETATWENRGRPRSYWLESMVRILCSAHVHGITNPAHSSYARNLARQQQAEEAERGQHLSAEDKLVWARERFRADCAARAIRTSEDAEWHYTRIRDARSAVVRAHSI